MLWYMHGLWGVRFVPVPPLTPANDRSEDEIRYYTRLALQDYLAADEESSAFAVELDL